MLTKHEVRLETWTYFDCNSSWYHARKVKIDAENVFPVKFVVLISRMNENSGRSCYEIQGRFVFYSFAGFTCRKSAPCQAIRLRGCTKVMFLDRFLLVHYHFLLLSNHRHPIVPTPPMRSASGTTLSHFSRYIPTPKTFNSLPCARRKYRKRYRSKVVREKGEFGSLDRDLW